MSIENIRGNIKQSGNSITVDSGKTTQLSILNGAANGSAISLTLPRLTASGGIVGIIHGGTASKDVVFDTSGSSSSNRLTITAAITGGSKTLTVPNATDTIALLATSQTLTNKTIVAGNNIITGITNNNIDASAAIAYSKLSLTGSIVNADISGSASIDQSKVNLSITNTEINASANIALSKLASLTNSIVAITDGSGKLTSSSVTATTLGYLDATSSIQTQLNSTISLTGTQTLSNKTLEFLNLSTATATLDMGELTITKGVMLITSVLSDLFTLTYSGVAAGTHVTIINASSDEFNITDDDNIITDTNVRVKIGASMSFIYNGSAWVLSGGAGGGAGAAIGG